MVPKTRAPSLDNPQKGNTATLPPPRLVPAMGKICLPRSHIKHLTQSPATLAQRTGDPLQNLQVSLDSLANVVLDNHSPLDLLLAERGGDARLLTRLAALIFVPLTR